MGAGQSGGTRARTGKARGKKGGGGGGGGPSAHAAAAATGPTPSKAIVGFSPDYSAKEIAGFTQQYKAMFGDQFRLQDFASAAGAPDNAKVVLDFEKGWGAIPSTFTASVYSPDLQNMSRTFYVDKRGQRIIKNDIFVAATTGTGLGLKLFSAQVASAKALGFAAIKTEASRESGYNGYSTWAKFGYNAKLGHYVRDQLKNAGLGRPRSIHELRATQAGRDWWNKNGTTTNMRFNLAPGSRSRRVLEAYAAEVASRPPR